MKLGDAAYTKLVEKHMAHSRLTLTEKEMKKEIASIEDGAVSKFADNPPVLPGTFSDSVTYGSGVAPSLPKRRGRPLGSRNKPKAQR